MSDQNDDKLQLDHEYDGIKELNNPLPNWWLLIFIGTIIFSFIYILYYHFGLGGPSSDQELQADLKEVQMVAEKNAPPTVEVTEESLLALVSNTEAVKRGQEVFSQQCAACHGAKGEGTIGPNLTDSAWIHGEGKLVDIVKTINEGVGDKGMPAWKSVIKAEDIHKITAYIRTLKGSNPPNGKAPQGTEYN